MSATVELDPAFKSSIKLLHSSKSDSAEKIRLALDELIKQKHGSSKMLINTLSKKHLAEEKSSPGSNLTVRKQKHIERKLSSVSNPVSVATTPETINIPDDGSLILTLSADNENEEDDDDCVVEVENRMKELEDLMCVACRRMELSARNRLVECAECHSLYHQECHKPNPISEEEANDHSWICCICKGKLTPKTSSPSPSRTIPSTKLSKNYESSSSSTSSSGKHKSSTKSESSSSKTNKKDSKEREKDRDKHKEKDRDKDKDKDKDKERHHKDKHSKSKEKDRDRDADKDKDKDSDKEKEKEKEKDKSSKSQKSSSSSSVSSSSVAAPNINIISADKRFQSIKKKLQESKRKHK